MVESNVEHSAALGTDLPAAPRFSLRGMLIGLHLTSTLLSLPGVGLFVWQMVGPFAAVAATVVAAQCAIMLLLAILGWLPTKVDDPTEACRQPPICGPP
jgi:hypothetical protein